MIMEKYIAGILIFQIIEKVKSHVEVESEDYFFPLEPVINFCKMSETCQHDWIYICGQDSLGVTRMFNDYCDMYEFNCDERKQFRHVQLNVCEFQIQNARTLVENDGANLIYRKSNIKK